MARSSLGHRFWTLWTAFTASNLGDGLTLVAFPLLAVQLTDDARLIGLVAFFRFLPFVMLGLPAGVILDRFDRRVVAIGAQILRGAALVSLALVVLTDDVTMTLLMISAFVVGAGEVLIDGGLPALVRTLVQSTQLEVANSRLSASQTVSNLFVGPPLGAVLFELEPAAPFVAAVALFGASGGLLGRLPGTYRPPPAEAAPLRSQLTVGLRYVWGHPVLRPLALVVAVFAFFGEAGNAVFVVLATERLGLGSVGFGLLITIDAVASVSMALMVARLVGRTSHATSMRVSVVCFALSGLLLGTTTVVAVAVLAMLIGGISDPTWNIVSATIRQRLVPDEVFGRMMTAYLFIAWGIQPLGALLGGFVAEAWGPEWVYLLSGTAVGSLFVLGRPLFRAVDAAMLAPEHET